MIIQHTNSILFKSTSLNSVQINSASFKNWKCTTIWNIIDCICRSISCYMNFWYLHKFLIYVTLLLCLEKVGRSATRWTRECGASTYDPYVHTIFHRVIGTTQGNEVATMMFQRVAPEGCCSRRLAMLMNLHAERLT